MNQLAIIPVIVFTGLVVFVGFFSLADDSVKETPWHRPLAALLVSLLIWAGFVCGVLYTGATLVVHRSDAAAPVIQGEVKRE